MFATVLAVLVKIKALNNVTKDQIYIPTKSEALGDVLTAWTNFRSKFHDGGKKR